MKCLPDIKTANKVVELILKNASIAVTGIWQADDDGVLNPANIELKPGATVTEEELRTFSRQHLAGFKVPKVIVFGEVPKTSTGKIQKFALRERAKSASAIG